MNSSAQRTTWERKMAKSKDSFLSRSTVDTALPPPIGGCFPTPWPPMPWPLPWPGDLAIEGLAARAAMRTIKYQLPALQALPPEAQEATVAALLDGLQQNGLLTAAEVDSLRGVSEGRRFDAPLYNPDGSPSLCGLLGQLLTPSPTRSTASTILGAAIGAGAGAALGGVPGAVTGAIVGGLLGSLAE